MLMEDPLNTGWKVSGKNKEAGTIMKQRKKTYNDFGKKTTVYLNRLMSLHSSPSINAGKFP